MRSKEDAMDYRYFPEPDLLPLVLSVHDIESHQIGELPIDRREKYLGYGLLSDDARILSERRDLSDFYDEVTRLTDDPKKSASMITTVLFALMTEAGDEERFGALKF